jgi:hypothetical protein
MRDLRALTATGALLVLAGALFGWFERSPAAVVDAPVTVVRPDGVLGLGAAAWALLVPVVVAPFVPSSRRAVLATFVAVLPAVVMVCVAAALQQRRAVDDETIGELVAERTIGQGLSVVGVAILVMALGTALGRAPDWRVPPRWWHRSVTDP